MNYCDLSPPATPSLDQQRDVLRKGLGRAMQWALRGQLDQELLLAACLADQRFDMDVADARGMWLWKMIQAIGATEQFRIPILNAIRNFTDKNSAQQLCQLARCFSETGDESFRSRLHEIVEQKPIKDLPWLGEEELLALDGLAAFRFAAQLRGHELMTRDWEWHDNRLIEIAIDRFGEAQINDLLSNSTEQALRSFQSGWSQEQQRLAERTAMVSARDQVRAMTASEIITAAHSNDGRFRQFRGWGMGADQSELEIVLQHLWATHSANALTNLLSVFGNRALPQFDARLMEFCKHEDAKVRRRAFGALAKNTHSLIRRFALERLERSVTDGAIVSLFVNNYELGDEQRLLESLELPPDEGERHSLLMDVNRVLEENTEADCSRLAVIVYAETPCENCRFFALRLLDTRQVMPDWMREECRYDSAEDCRQLVGC